MTDAVALVVEEVRVNSKLRIAIYDEIHFCFPHFGLDEPWSAEYWRRMLKLLCDFAEVPLMHYEADDAFEWGMDKQDANPNVVPAMAGPPASSGSPPTPPAPPI